MSALVFRALCFSLPLVLVAENSSFEHGGLPNLPTRLEETSTSWDVSGEFLIWFASEQLSSAWFSQLTTLIEGGMISDTFSAPSLRFDWDVGFRVGLGYGMEYDEWDTQLHWSRFCTRAQDSVSGGVILPEFFGAFLHGDGPNFGTIDWSLFYNMIDWDLGRSYWVSEYLSFRPFFGLQGGWIDQTIHSQWHVVSRSVGGVSIPVDYLAHEDLHNNFWGVGPLGGINTKWILGHTSSYRFHLFGDVSSAWMWGVWACDDVYTNPTPASISTNMADSNLGALMLQGIVGLGWDAKINKMFFSLQMGFETQFWLNQLRIPTFQQLRLHGDLTLQGGTFKARLDF